MATTIRDIDERVAGIDTHLHFESIFDLLEAYGTPKSTLTKLRKGLGRLNRAKHAHELWWKDKVYYRFEEGATKEELLESISQIESITGFEKVVPRFLIVASETRLLAKDTKTSDTIDIKSSQLIDQTAFFAPWAKIEKTAIENTNLADVKAAEKMAKLYDEILKKNEVTAADEIHALNVFFARLLFCFFAEDTGVFDQESDTIFTNTIASLSQVSGEDLGDVFADLFEVLDTPMDQRDGVPAHFAKFGYVNGKLFSERTPTPMFTSKSRAIILECGELNWAQINPDIFGSMIQAVVHADMRSGLGMHYTSVENIMKVLRPLFLDELDEEFDAASGRPKKLKKLLDRIANIRVFDPACGSGNFLIIAYKELRHLEHRILQQLHEVEAGELSAGMAQSLFPDPRVKLENFYGIEIDDFAAEIATLSLWLAKHQMNLEFREMFDRMLPLIPLRDQGNVIHGNATRMDWQEVCPPDGEAYVCGNPPYRGVTFQTPENKMDLASAFGNRPFDRNLDYVSAWFVLGGDFVRETGASLGFVATNSVSQGTHVAMLWPHVLIGGVEIAFAHRSFKWSNSARGGAGVTVCIIGLAIEPRRKLIFDEGTVRTSEYINPYLTSARVEPVERAPAPISGLPPMNFGNKATDDGNLSLDKRERDHLVAGSPEASSLVLEFMGAREFLNGTPRYCLWIRDEDEVFARSIPAVAERIDRVEQFRKLSKKAATRAIADRPYRFQEARHRMATQIIVPRVTSERREYVPIGFLGQDTVVSDLANVVYDAEPWVFGLIQSRMHMVWVRAVAGRMKTDYRYSAVLCYNTFPVPPLSEKQNTQLTEGATKILATREQFAGKTLAELYDPDKMPDPLREAHKDLDEIVDRIYQPRRPFPSDEARLERLFMMYAKATGKASPETLEQLALLDE